VVPTNCQKGGRAHPTEIQIDFYDEPAYNSEVGTTDTWILLLPALLLLLFVFGYPIARASG